MRSEEEIRDLVEKYEKNSANPATCDAEETYSSGYRNGEYNALKWVLEDEADSVEK